MGEVFLTGTTSTCPTCGRLVPAQLLARGNAVYLRRGCPEHGLAEPRICSDAQQYLALSRFHRAGSLPLEFQTPYRELCPGSCGLCPNHEQHVCMPILEITDHCDLACPICLAHSRPGGTYHIAPEQASATVDRLLRSEGQIDILTLSGGEPTVHPQFRQIIDACRRDGVLYLSVSTNGLRLSRDPELLDFLAEREVVISLQFDGTDPEACTALRGRNIVEEKLRLIDLAARHGVRMSLTFTAARGINEDRLHEPVELLFSREHILSVMIQPLAYVGAGAQFQRPVNPVDIPGVTRLLNGAAGTVATTDFTPLPCSHPACFSLAFYLRIEDGRFLSVSELLEVDRYLDLIQNRALVGTDAESVERIRDAMYELWSGPAATRPDSAKALQAIRKLLDAAQCKGRFCASAATTVAQKSLKSIFIHHFMDRHSFDLSRCRKCCQVYPQPDGRLVPACVYNCLQRGS